MVMLYVSPAAKAVVIRLRAMTSASRTLAILFVRFMFRILSFSFIFC